MSVRIRLDYFDADLLQQASSLSNEIIMFVINVLKLKIAKIIRIFRLKGLDPPVSVQICIFVGKALDADLYPPGLWIRIRIRIGSVFNWKRGSGSGSGSRRAKMTHKSRKNSCFEVLDGLFCELEASAVTWTYFMEA